MSSNTIYYVYFYLRSKDSNHGIAGTPYYIGKGSKNRAWAHHTNIPQPKDKKYILIVENNLNELQAFMWERYYFRWFGRLDLGTGILHNKSEGGEGGGCKGPLHGLYGKTGEDNPNSINFWAIDPNGIKHIAKGIKQFASLHNLCVSNIRNVMKGIRSSYKGWTFGYIEKPIQQKQLMRKKPKYNSGKNNAKYDFTIYKFLNTETKESFEGERFDFIKTYNLNKGNVCEIINGNRKTHLNWIFVEKIS